MEEVYQDLTLEFEYERSQYVGKCFHCETTTTVPHNICHDCAADNENVLIEKNGTEYHVYSIVERKKNTYFGGIRKNTLPKSIYTYTGEIMEELDFIWKYANQGNEIAMFVIETEDGKYIDSTNKPCLLSLINYGHNPNCEFVDIDDHIYLYFTRDIQKYEELCLKIPSSV